LVIKYNIDNQLSASKNELKEITPAPNNTQSTALRAALWLAVSGKAKIGFLRFLNKIFKYKTVNLNGELRNHTTRNMTKHMATALIIIDIQNDYFDKGSNPLSGSDEATKNARLILDDCRSRGLPIIHIQHLATRSTATFFLPNTIGADIYADVRPLDNEKVIVKNYPNSFRETELLEYLTFLNVSQLVICGMMTHMCVDATTRAAKDFGFECTIISDACATKDLEIDERHVKAADVQTSFLAALNYFYSTVKSTKQFLTMIK